MSLVSKPYGDPRRAHHHPQSKADWVKLFKKTFKFNGAEITGEFLMSIATCPGPTGKTAWCTRRSRGTSLPGWTGRG